MLAAQRVFGSHDTRQRDADPVAMGRNLHPLLPEDAHDRQPFAGEGERFLLVADLRLDNRADLDAALALDRRGRSDAEMLLLAWERWGENALDRIEGDYAFALWDARDRRLILARDHAGMRPLHYHRGAGFIAFASMPRGLHALPEIPHAPDIERVAERLALLPETGPRSFFEGISRVEAGHLVILTPDRTVSRRYWNPPRPARRKVRTNDAIMEMRALLDRSVKSRLRGAEGHVGAHLSAGLDSAAVTSTAARLMAEAGGRLTAYTAVPRAGYADPEPWRRIGDEGALAGEVAALYANIEHVRAPTDAGTPLDRLDRDFHLFDRPVQNLCNQRWIAQINGLARERGLKILLTGTAGNMSLSYGGVETLAELAASGRWLRLARVVRELSRGDGLSWRQAIEKSLGPWIPEPLWDALHRWRGKPRHDVASYSAIRPARFAALELDRRARERGLDLSYRPYRNGYDVRLMQLIRTDPGNYNKGMLAGWGVDHRDPLADRRLIEFCLSLPTETFLHGGVPRGLARAVLADRLPPGVLNERRRGMQAVDWHEGMDAAREGFREEVGRLREVPAAAEALDLDRMEQLIEHWPDEWQSREAVERYRLALVRGVASGHFLRRASGSNA